MGDAPGEGGAEVVELGVEPLQPRGLLGTAELGLRPCRERHAPRQMAVAEILLLPGRLEPLERVLPDRFQLPVTALAALTFEDDERLQRKLGEEVEDLRLLDTSTTANLLRGAEREPAGKDREPAKEHLLLLAKQLVAPVHGRPQRLVACERRAACPREEPETVAESLLDLMEGQCSEPRRRELEREGNALEAAAYGAHRPSIRPCEGEVWIGCQRTVEEELNGLGPGEILQRYRVDLAEARAREPARAPRPELPAAPSSWRGWSGRRGGEQPLDKARTRVDEMLAVVENEERLLRG